MERYPEGNRSPAEGRPLANRPNPLQSGDGPGQDDEKELHCSLMGTIRPNRNRQLYHQPTAIF